MPFAQYDSWALLGATPAVMKYNLCWMSSFAHIKSFVRQFECDVYSVWYMAHSCTPSVKV